MAWVQIPMLARLTFRDNDGAESTCQANLPAGAGAAAGLSFVSSWRPVVEALSSAVCIEADLVLQWRETSVTAAGAGADVYRHGVLIFNTPMPDLAIVRVPSLNPSMLETTGPFAGVHIDQALADVIALVSALTAGIGSIEPCDPFENDLATLSSASVEQL